MKLLRLLPFIPLVLLSASAWGQSEVPEAVPEDTMVISDSSITIQGVDPEIPEAAPADRKAIRKERNTLEFSSALQMSQTQFDNWAGGGENTFAGHATVLLLHKFEKGRLTTDTHAEAKYGLSYVDSEKYKNEDEFKVNFVVGWKIKGNWSYAASASFRSQFSTSYKSRDDRTRVSTFMAPGFLDLAVGFKYDRKPVSIVLSPIGGNAVFVLDDELSDQGINGVTPGKHSLWTLGPSVQANLDMTFVKEVFRLRSYLYAFTNFKKRPVVRWETTLDIKATSYLSTTVSALLHYDRESNARHPKNLQYKYAFAVGLAYTFKNK